MIIDKITKNAINITKGNRWIRGNEYYEIGNVYNLNLYIQDNYLGISSVVEGSRAYKDYNCSIDINIENLEIEKTACTCDDYNERKLNKQAYMCKHLVATLLEGVENLEQSEEEFQLNELHKHAKNNAIENEVVLEKVSPQDAILDNIFDEEIVKLEVLLNFSKDKSYTSVEFKIGNNKMYVLKNLKDFVDARMFRDSITYGKDFTYNVKKHIFSNQDEKIVSYIEEMVMINENLSLVPKYKRQIELIDGKSINLEGHSLGRFLHVLKNKSFSINIDDKVYKSNVLFDDLPISFNLVEDKTHLVVKTDEIMPLSLNNSKDVFFYNENVYLPSSSQCNAYRYFYDYLKNESKIIFDKSKAQDVITKVIPKLEQASKNVYIDDKLSCKIKKDLTTKIYLDRKKDIITLDLKFVYNNEKNKDCYIVKDINKESYIKQSLNNFKFVQDTNDKFLFEGTQFDLYILLSDKIRELKELGEVYYSDRFKYNIINPNINANIGENKNRGFLEINFNIENVDESEYRNILKSFKENQRFHRLKNDTILDLKDDKAKEFFKLLDNLVGDVSKDIDGKVLKINNNKSIYLNELVKNDKLDFINGKEYVKTLSSKIKTINNLDSLVPTDLNASLRDYQVQGYKWLKTLSHYGFGGILADEMGLGKTIQAISFLLSQKSKKSLIITPTSLIYNWKDEIENFAPNMSVLIMHGDKNQRIKLFDVIDDYDIVLTTYSTLRNDYEYYEKLHFDCLIIDEAQNIKNPFAQNTQCVKNISASNRFALTGTPIENNLIELWSIFDFLMPGYLFSKKDFEEKFIKNENNIQHLKRMINPFVLRRLKKDVLEELPEKIEKKFFVEMNSKQKKTYLALINDINQKRKSKEYKQDKITILSYLTKLRQICLDPAVLIEDYNGRSSKVDVCMELIKENIKENHKILLFSQFTSVLKRLGESLDKENINYSYLDGSTSASKRISLVNEFNSNAQGNVFLISLKAGGTGLNLTSADVVIHFDPWWNPAIENQATDRAHRFGQKNVVEVIKLIAKGTIEEKIVKLQDDKKNLIEKIMSSDMNNASILSSLTENDINELFNLY